MSDIIPVIAIDGPSGSGKGTLSQLLANKLGWTLLDSGAIYRVLSLAAEHHDVALDNEDALVQLAGCLDVQFIPGDNGINVILEGEDVSSPLRLETTGNGASKVAALPRVREALLRRQRAFRALPGLVADGRDMGTVVFTDAPVKVFLDASSEARAQRRFEQLRAKGEDVTLAHLLSEIQERDHRDRNRSVAPLQPAEDALILDSTAMTIETVLQNVLDYIQVKLPSLITTSAQSA